MKKYEKYKDCGIDELNKIPENWEIVNFRYLIDILTDYTANGSFGDLAKNVDYLEEGYSRLIRLTDLRANFENVGIYLNEHSHNYLSKSELFGGEVLLANVGAYAGLAWVFKNFQGKASLGPNMFLLRFKERLDNDFAYISLISDYLHNQLLNKATSSAQPKLNKEDVRSCYFVLPPKKEQVTIASYLDHKTTKIDTLIEKKEQLNEKLKLQRQAIINEAVTKGLNPNAPMKNSGIEWLGEIPEHWEIKKAKYLLNEESGIKIGPFGSALKLDSLVESGIKIYGQGNVIKDDFSIGERFLPIDRFEEDFTQYEILEGDVLVTMMGTTGKSKVFRKEFERGILDSHLLRLRFDENKFISNLFSVILEQSDYISQQIVLMSRGSIMAGLNSTIIKELKILVPPIQEQKKLLEFINQISKKIDEAVEKIHLSIEKLKRYRQSIISEAVTGKIDVRDWEKKTNQ